MRRSKNAPPQQKIVAGKGLSCLWFRITELFDSVDCMVASWQVVALVLVGPPHLFLARSMFSRNSRDHLHNRGRTPFAGIRVLPLYFDRISLNSQIEAA